MTDINKTERPQGPADEFEDDVRASLEPLRGEALPVDAEFLRALRERSALEFERSAAAGSDATNRGGESALSRKRDDCGEVGAGAEGGRGALTTISIEQGRRRMPTPLRRAVAAAAACAAALVMWFAGGFLSTARGVTLDDVLHSATSARSLQLELHRDGKQAEVWVSGGNRLRWDDAPGQYSIARGSQLWRVDEATNTAERSQSPWTADDDANGNKQTRDGKKAADSGVDLVALLETGGSFQVDGVERWLTAEPTGEAEYLGRTCRVFEQELPTNVGLVRLAAYADLRTDELQGLVAWRAESPAGPPLAELRLVARNVVVDEAKFVVADSLTADGRIGKVLDVQGLVAMQPPLARRWTPVCGPVLLKPDDWIRTETRGANAVRLVLSSQTEVTLGPGALLELISPTQVRVHRGEVQAKVAAGAEKSFVLLGKGDAKETVSAGAAAIFLRRDADAALLTIKDKPRWLAGFERSTNDESLGSLIATVDGQNVPLSVGYHKVTVDIRDQIARTTIEESFVNHTPGRLEGVFYFPLPADASISGFGMWIGNELVEADVVEKQRAREIYETILREKRDPGLLEWTSGNLFKARVFPIEAHSEKRVKLVYTQVLPMRDNRYVYSYGLRSELLRTKPLRELGIDVRVSSELPLRSVACPTHDVRSELTAHAAHVQFEAQEYAPTRDFEVVCEIDGRQSDVVVIPHQRGNDGYFLVQLTPPSPAGNLRRETLGEDAPLEVLLVCDTSGSMDSECRRQQREFVTTVLSSLGPDDKFNLAACDVEVTWALNQTTNGEVASATGEHIDQALKFLDERHSLGWTDLDKTFAAVLERVSTGAQVIYIGDGVPSAGDADPQALAARLRRQYEATPRGTFHAVAVGNIVEPTVLKTIASLGGGSQRQIGGEMSPQRVALELLREVTEPGLRDLRVEFSGVQVAAVYPEQLPNLAAGAQQILVGRYLPQAGEQRGELIVTGRRGEETVSYATRVNFPPAPSPSEGRVGEGEQPSTGDPKSPERRAVVPENPGTRDATALRSVATGDRARLLPPRQGEGDGGNEDEGAGNSFIPRLWARQHLDHLLAQGASQAIQEEIIAMSEQFHIITPYTSLLVLETDADRERFGVKRRFQMRDGERFFATGRDNANFELMQQQMKLAGDWRLGLRQQILAGLAGLGRDAQVFQQAVNLDLVTSTISGVDSTTVIVADGGTVLLGGERQLRRGGSEFYFGASVGFPMSGPVSTSSPMTPYGGGYGGGGGGGGFGGRGFGDRWDVLDEIAPTEFKSFNGPLDLGEISTRNSNRSESSSLGGELDAEMSFEGDKDARRSGFFGDYDGADFEAPMQQLLDSSGSLSGKFMADSRFEFSLGKKAEATYLGFESSESAVSGPADGAIWEELSSRRRVRYGRIDRAPGGWDYRYTQWLDAIVPGLPAVGPATKPQATTWPEEAVAIAKSLLRTEALHSLEGGLEIRRIVEGRDPRWDRITSRNEQLELYAPTAWLTRPLGEGVHTIVNWYTAEERGVFSRAFELGRVRASVEHERREIPLGLGDDSLQPLFETYRGYEILRIERAAVDRVVLVLAPKNDMHHETRLTIDTKSHVLAERQQVFDGVVASRTVFADFTQVAGMWWAQQIITCNGDNEVTSHTTQTIAPLTADEFKSRLAEELPAGAASRGAPTPPAPAPAILIHFPLPKLQKAKEAVASGSAGVEAHLVLLVDHVARQQWDDAFKRLASIEALVPASDDSGKKPWAGLRWVRIALEQVSRRNADAHNRITSEAQQLASRPQADRFALAGHLLGVGGKIADANEQLALLEILRPVFIAQPEYVVGVTQWQQRRVDLLRSLGRTTEMLALERELATAVPWDVHRQTQYAGDLAIARKHEDAYAWLRQELNRNPRREDGEKNQLAFTHADLLDNQGRYGDEAVYLAARVELQPESQEVYDRYLSALVFADRLADAEATVEKWLQIDGGAAKLPTADATRLQAAVNYALGQRRNINMNRSEEKWQAPLAAVARRLATHEFHADVAGRIMGDWRFSDSDEADGVRRDLFARLKAEAGSLTPAQLSSLASWTINGPPAPPAEAWRDIVATIRRRWTEAANAQQKDTLGAALATIYSNRFADSEYLPFLRARIESAAKEYRIGYVSQLFEALLARPWTNEGEAELFGLLPQLSDAAEPVDKLPAELPALYRLVDRMIQARVEAAQRELQATGHPEKLTRTEVADKTREFLKAAREGVADRLTESAASVKIVAADPLAKWMTLERFTLDVQLERQLDETAAACWAVLGDAPPAPPKEAAEDDETTESAADQSSTDGEQSEAEDPAVIERAIRAALFDGVYRGRHLAIVTYLAARRNANPELPARLLKFFDAGIANGGAVANVWRSAKYSMLIVLDRPDELERELRTWIAADGPVSPWRASLGRLMAERGKLAEAIGVFESIRTNDQLAPADLAALAQWYLAVDRRADYERTTVDAYMAADEYSLRRTIESRVQYWRQPNVPLPTELDERVLLVFQALFRKANSPGDYVWLLREYYEACHDFRLLRMVPDAVLGRTQQQVYPFLESLNSNLFGNVRDEAVVDEMVKRIGELRTPEASPLNARALNLLEAMLERRSTEVLNQPGPHAAAAVAALERSFRAEWADGERLQMARLLAQLGNITVNELAAEQVRQLRELHAQSEAKSLERLQIASWLARGLFDSYGKRDEGLAVMQVEVGEFERAHEGVWPGVANEPLDAYVELLKRHNRYAEAETLLKRLAEKPDSPDMSRHFVEQLDGVYLAALDGDGQVSLGTGEELYRNLREYILAKLDTDDQDHRYQIIMQALDLFRRANNKQPLQAAAKRDLRAFAFETLPGVLKRQTTNYESVISQTADRLKEINGPRDGLEFLVVRMADYPPWLDMSWQNAWNQFGWRLGQWRTEVGDNLGDVEPKLLALVLTELRRDLRSRESRNGYLYNSNYRWDAKAGDFARVAHEILDERRSSGRSVKYIANYLWGWPNRRGDAIEALFIAHRAEILDDGGQQQLVVYLQEEQRFGEPIALLEGLIERIPDNVDQRRQLMIAYFKTQRLEQLRALLASSDAHFRAEGRWNENAVATLASACVATQLSDEAVGYYDEVIALVQRQQPGGGMGNDSLPRYYIGLADAYSALGKTDKAVDAAAGAVVSWGPRSERRQEGIEALRRVLAAAKDLNDYAAVVDRKAEETGEDSPLIRKMLGEVLLEKGQHAAAETQLRAAIALEPTDLGAHASLVKCLDAEQKKDEAVVALLASIDVDRRNLTLLGQLADRLAGSSTEAERGATMLVEASPQEAENHSALAELRQKTDRWADAIDQWRHVARIRSREPDGLLKLAEAQIHLQQWSDADATIQKLLKGEWPPRYSNLNWQIQQLQQQVTAGRK